MSSDDVRDHCRLFDAHRAGRAGHHRLALARRPRQRTVGVRIGRAVAVARHRHAWHWHPCHRHVRHRHVSHVHVRRMASVITANETAAQWHRDDCALQHDGGETAKDGHAGMLVVLRRIEQSGLSRRVVRVSATLPRGRRPSRRNAKAAEARASAADVWGSTPRRRNRRRRGRGSRKSMSQRDAFSSSVV